MTPPTIEEAVSLYMGIPSLVSADGDATVKQRAMACEIVRLPDIIPPGETTPQPNPQGWRVQYPQERSITLASGEVVPLGIGATSPPLYASDLIGQTVEIGGQQWPVALAFAIINAVYVREASVAN